MDDPGDIRPVSPTLISAKCNGKRLIGHLINKEVKEVNIINANQNGLMKNKSPQTDSITFSTTLLVSLIIKMGLMK